MFEIKEVSNVEATAKWGWAAALGVGVGSNALLWGVLLPAALAC